MPAVLIRIRADLRARWRAWLGLTLLMGVAAGAVVNAAAGARRTDSAYPRFLRASQAADALFFDASADPGFATISREQLNALPQTAETASIVGYATSQTEIDILGPGDDRYGRTVGRQKMLSGRRPVRANEVMVGFLLAEQRHLHVGDHLTVYLLPRQADPDAEAPPPRPFTFDVVGIEAAPGEFPPQSGGGFHTAVVSRAFIQEHAGELEELHATAVRLKRGSADVPALRKAVNEIGGGKPTNAFLLRDQAVNTERSIHLQAVALWLLAALLGLTSALILSQLFLRQSLLEANEHPALRALGMERSQLWAIAMGRALFIGLGASVVAVITAVLLSPLTPVGIARLAEPSPGVAVDLVVLGVGALATVLLALAVAAWPAWRASRPPSRADEARSARSTAIGDALTRTSTPPPVAAGVRMALDPGRGRSAVPVRSTVLGAAVGIGALAGALVFNGSLAHLLNSPQLYGVAWDARVTTTSGGQASGKSVENLADDVQADPELADLAIGYVGVPLQIENARVDAVVLQPLRGTFQPRVLEGRLPLGPDEILLGSRTLAEIGARVGDPVDVTLLGVSESAPLQVVGRGILPSTSDAMGLGKGASMSIEAASRLLSPSGGPAPERPRLNSLIVRFKPEVDPAAGRARLAQLVARSGPDFIVVAPDKPTDVVNFGRVQNLPLVLAGLLAALAAATLTHLLVTSIRRRGPELAILKTVGFVPRQVRTAVACQATTLAIVAMLIGLPLGIAAGRWAWIFYAHQLGIVPAPIVPILVVLLLVPGTLIVANIVAVIPATLAARLRPARALRAE